MSREAEENKQNTRVVLCQDPSTSEVSAYASVKDAAVAQNTSAANISNALHGRQKTAAGRTWSFAPEPDQAQLFEILVSGGVQVTFSTTPQHEDQANGSITVIASGGVPPYLYFVDNNRSHDSTFDGLSAGQHRVTVADSRGQLANGVATVGFVSKELVPQMEDTYPLFNIPFEPSVEIGFDSTTTSFVPQTDDTHFTDVDKSWHESTSFDALNDIVCTSQFEPPAGIGFNASTSGRSSITLKLVEGHFDTIRKMEAELSALKDSVVTNFVFSGRELLLEMGKRKLNRLSLLHNVDKNGEGRLQHKDCAPCADRILCNNYYVVTDNSVIEINGKNPVSFESDIITFETKGSRKKQVKFATYETVQNKIKFKVVGTSLREVDERRLTGGMRTTFLKMSEEVEMVVHHSGPYSDTVVFVIDYSSTQPNTLFRFTGYSFEAYPRFSSVASAYPSTDEAVSFYCEKVLECSSGTYRHYVNQDGKNIIQVGPYHRDLKAPSQSEVWLEGVSKLTIREAKNTLTLPDSVEELVLINTDPTVVSNLKTLPNLRSLDVGKAYELYQKLTKSSLDALHGCKVSRITLHVELDKRISVIDFSKLENLKGLDITIVNSNPIIGIIGNKQIEDLKLGNFSNKGSAFALIGFAGNVIAKNSANLHKCWSPFNPNVYLCKRNVEEGTGSYYCVTLEADGRFKAHHADRRNLDKVLTLQELSDAALRKDRPDWQKYDNLLRHTGFNDPVLDDWAKIVSGHSVSAPDSYTVERISREHTFDSIEPGIWHTDSLAGLKRFDIITAKGKNGEGSPAYGKFIVNSVYGSRGYRCVTLMPYKKRIRNRVNDAIRVTETGRMTDLMTDLFPVNRLEFRGWKRRHITDIKVIGTFDPVRDVSNNSSNYSVVNNIISLKEFAKKGDGGYYDVSEISSALINSLISK